MERLPEGLPDWYARDDANADGQVTMAEFSSSWSEIVVADFYQFDRNRDGVITPQEAVKAKEAGVIRGTIVAAPPSAASATVAVSASASGTASPTPPPAPLPPPPVIEGLDPKYVKFAQDQIRRYDRNNDAQLAEDEWRNMRSDVSGSDANGDKIISIEELARFYKR